MTKPNNALRIFLYHMKGQSQLLLLFSVAAVVAVLCINPITPELLQHAVPRPRASRHNIILNSFFSLPCLYSGFDLQLALRAFVMVGEAGFSTLRGERVKDVLIIYCGMFVSGWWL